MLQVAQPIQPLAYNRRDAAAALGISERTLFDLVKAKRIREFKIGTAVRIPRSELEKFIADSLGESGQKGEPS